jgi:N-acetylglucosamine-6-phosphate deacetylase
VHTLHGLEVRTGHPIALAFDRVMTSVEPGASGADSYLAPGWIDLQVNGFGGVDYNTPGVPLDAIARSIDALLATGTTRVWPTVITGAPEAMCAALATLAAARESLPLGEVFDGFHVEGPHISPEDGPRGAHPPQWVRAPDLDELARWQDASRGRLRMVTLAPEWPGAAAYIEAAVARGVIVAIGHTAATPDQIADAVSAGATMSTHLGNGAHRLMRRHPNHIWEQLADDRLTAGFIADGIHLPRSFLTVALRAKGPGRSVLVTDASAPACAAPGRYQLGAQAIDLTADGRVVLAGGDRLAGSALRLDRAIANVVRLAGLSLADAVAMATTTPATAGRLEGRTRGLAPGDRADLVRFHIDPADGALHVDETYVSGERVWKREGRKG